MAHRDISRAAEFGRYRGYSVGDSRKIVSVMQRMRRQENTGSGN
jgi:hypothetical protein